MDKNKSRTDLLAAGRKKLEKFRQKKDNKGGNSKPSGKTGKSGQDATVDAASAAVVTPQNVADGEKSMHDAQDTIVLSELHSRVDSVASNNVATAEELSGKAVVILDTTSTARTVEIPSEGPGVNETRMNESTGDGCGVDTELLEKGGSSSLVSEDAKYNVPGTLYLFRPGENSPDSGTPLLIPEVGHSTRNQIDGGAVAQIEGDNILSPNEFAESAEKAALAIAQLEEPDDISRTVVVNNDTEEAQESHDHSVGTFPLTESEIVSAVRSEVTGQQGKGLSSGLLDEEKTEMLNVLGGYRGHVGAQLSPDVVEERSFEFKIDGMEKFIGCTVVDLSSGLDGGLIKLSRLAEILQILDEDEFKFLFMSREMSPEKSRDANTMTVHQSALQDTLERLKEELYVASFARDTFHLQLSEHQKLIDEISMANASLNEVQGKNEVLAEEIGQCRCELLEVATERERLDKNLHLAKSQVEEFSTEVNELQYKLETAQGDISNLSLELVHCRNLVAALQAENENSNGRFKIMTEEKKKLLEENDNILLENNNMIGQFAECKAHLETLQMENANLVENVALLRDDMRRLEEENDCIIHEKNNLLADLADYKSTVEALKSESKISNEIFKSVSEERKNLEEEKESVVQQTVKLSKELTDCKDLVVTLQTEISNIHWALTSATEEKNKYEEEKNSIFSEYEKQWHELVEIKVFEASLGAEYRKAVDDLKEAAHQINQLTEENEILKSDLEFHKSSTGESDQKKCLSPFVEVAHRSVESEILILRKPNSERHADRSFLENLKSDVYDDSSGFVALKKHLVDAGVAMQKLDKAIEGMHLHATSYSKSSDKVNAPAVSRLIQAFESKNHNDDHDLEESFSSENQTTADPFTTSQIVIQNLRALLDQLVLDSESASEFCMGMKQSKLYSGTELRSDYDSLRKHTDLVEEANIELMVLYEFIRERLCYVVGKEGDLLILCDALQKQELILKLENNQLREKLNDFQAKSSELQSKLDKIYQDSNEIVASISNQLQILQIEMVDRETIIEEEWNSVISQVLQTVVKLDATIETFHLTPLTAANSDLDVVSHVSSSVFGATKVIEGLYEQLEAAKRDRLSVSDAYDDMRENWSNLQGKNEMAIQALCKLYKDLSKLVSHETENEVVDDKVLDLLHPDLFCTLIDHLKNFLAERLQLEYSNKQLDSELMISARKIDELEKKCLKSDTIIKLVEDIEQSVQPQGKEIYADEPASRLESLIYLLIKKYKEADHGLSFSTSLEAKLSDLQEQVEDLTLNLVQYENENLVFKESLKIAEEDAVALNSKVREKVAELGQSEQRVSSLREKLGIAVTKGKGLISQRDSLKQSLSEMSKELERASQELLSKDAMVHDLETKLKVYSEAGERMEALESELSYIRNSATALRESFLLKDSVLQRIEEILEDLELSEHFHSIDIIEKIDWLAKSVTGNPSHLGDWDQKNSIGGGSYSDAGFVSVDGLKEDMQPNSSSSDDLRRRYSELQSKFYELAEQNDMLEQSLMERNFLVQRWEESLDRVDMPSQLRSMEPEDKIQWFEKTLTESWNQCHSLQQKIDNLEGFCGSLTADMEGSQRKLSELDAAFQQACKEREILSKDLESLSHENTEISKKTSDFKIRNDNLQNEVNMLLEQKLRIEEDFHHTESVMTRLQNLVEDAFQDSIADNLPCGVEDAKYFEELLRKLLEKYRTLCSEKPINTENTYVHVTEKGEAPHISWNSDEQEMVMSSKKMEDLMGELVCLKDEKDRYMLNNQSLIREVEDLERNKNELRELLNQEEHKSTSLREKLNVAVRKGKSLVQQRDGMKQVIEELNAEVEHLKSDIKHTENAISEYEERIKELSTTQERAQVMESENSSLRDRLIEMEHRLQVKEDSLSNVLDALNNVDIGLAISYGNPIEKLKEMGNYIHDLRIALNSAEQESKKSKRAAELLLTELNEVQERSDVLQEELAKAADELSQLSKEKDSAEAAKYEALARVEKLSIHLEERDRQLSEVMVLKSGVDQSREDLFAFGSELGNVLSKDREVLHNVETMMQSFLESDDSPYLSALFPGGTNEGIILRKYENKIFSTEIGSLNEQLYKHSHLLREEIFHLSEVVRNVHKEFVAKESNETLKRDVKQLESIEKDKESELCSLRESISLLYEACAGAIFEIENWRDLAVGNALASRVTERNLKTQISIEGGNRIANDGCIFTGEGIRSMHDKLLSVVKDCISMQNEIKEVGHREMKSTIMDLQKELQEKDIQRDRICMELVNQIKEAETNVKNYLQDLQQARVHLLDLQRQFDAKEADFKVLKQRMKELQDHETNSLDLQQKVKSLTDALAAKEQETESLMQALDEEETQMEDLANKIGGLEIELQQKNQDLENLEASHTKALKKLSVTVSKFDELHYLSESLLSEVEKLQSELQDRDEEISFLRQEVTRCTNDALNVTQTSKKTSDEIHDLLTWLETLISRAKVHDVNFDGVKNYQVNEYKEVLKKQIMALASELDNLRLVAQKSDVLLQEERSKVEELAKKQQYLESSLRDKESEIVMLQGTDNSAKATNNTLEIVEVEPITNKRASPGTIAPQVRSLRKTNNDQVAIAIDVDHSTDRFEEDDDDKAHGFKSLTTSKIVPRFTRPVSDMIDGLWVSCDRALMRRPVLRLGVIFYWAVLHALLATFVV